MATVEFCDGGCGSKSPENGLFVANHWFEVTVIKRIDKAPTVQFGDKFLFCPKCAKAKQLIK